MTSATPTLLYIDDDAALARLVERGLTRAGYKVVHAASGQDGLDRLVQGRILYAADPRGRLGYLHDEIFRAVRLVLDTGLHSKRWTRAQAIRYYMETMGDPHAVAATEVDRYCVTPGQACSYMVGQMTWMKLRSRAQKKLGAKFDIRQFHDTALLKGPMPLEVLERTIDAWIERQT